MMVRMNKTPHTVALRDLAIETQITGIGTLTFTLRHMDSTVVSVAAFALAAALTPASLELRTTATVDAGANILGRGKGYSSTVRFEADTESQAIWLRNRFSTDRITERVLVVLGALLPAAKS
jgi:hypothetical protein